MSHSSVGGRRADTAVAPAGALIPRSLARLDRIGVWSMPFLFIGIIGTGFLFAFYDVFDINVSFIQSCVALKPGCTPANALSTLRIPVVLNLGGYVIAAVGRGRLEEPEKVVSDMQVVAARHGSTRRSRRPPADRAADGDEPGSKRKLPRNSSLRNSGSFHSVWRAASATLRACLSDPVLDTDVSPLRRFQGLPKLPLQEV
jgi:hypothetical protein